MSQLDEHLNEQFHLWEIRGRGWQVGDEPVYPEPPFKPFYGYRLPPAPRVDDLRKPNFLSSLVEKLNNQLSASPPPVAVESDPEEGPVGQILIREPLVELQTSLPAKLDISREAFDQFLSNLSFCREPIVFEVLGVPGRVVTQFAASAGDVSQVRRQLQAHFPEAVFTQRTGALDEAWEACEGDEVFALEFGLEQEFMLPLASGKIDPFIGIVGALAELQPGELGLFQILFQPTQHPWAESIVRSVTHEDGKPFFVNSPELTAAAERKVQRPLFAAVVRIMVRTASRERLIGIARDLAGSLRVFAHPQGNALIPLHNDDYPFAEHVEDVLLRQSRRTGMLLNSDELFGFVHLPSSAVRSTVLQRDADKTRAAPSIACQASGVLIGENVHAGKTVSVRLTADQRVRHTHIIGASGTGKSTLLFNLIQQDIQNGDGVAVLDPHGDLIERILAAIPEPRINDVVLVDLSDADFPVGFNILSAHSDLEKNLLASDLVSVFRRLATTWGDQMDTVLQNAILAFLESRRGGTLADLRRFLIEDAYRAEFLTTVQDPELIYYWQTVFPHLTGGKSIGPLLTRLQDFFSRKPLRNMVSQPANKLDFADIMDTGKIFLAKLPEGMCGAENTYLLGTLLMSKFQQIAMSRQAQQMSTRRNFWLYLDEFDHFITPSMAEILKGARKYRLGLTLAHQELHQLQSDPKVASAVATHPCTRIVFRVGDDDAKRLGDGFEFFDAQSLKRLETFQAIARVEKSDFDFNLHVQPLTGLDDGQAEARRQAVIAASRARYATPRAEVEAMLLANLNRAGGTARPAVPQRAEKKTAEVTKSPIQPAQATEPTIVPKVQSLDAQPLRIEAKSPEISVAPKSPATPTEPLNQREIGRGGEIHTTIQKLIQKEARALGFFAECESEISDKSKEAADLILRKDKFVIAVEIMSTSTADWEFGKVKKCLSAGIERIVIVSPYPEKLKAIANAIRSGLGDESSSKVQFYRPEDFISALKTIAAENIDESRKSDPEEKTILGYKVKRRIKTPDFEEQKLKEATLHQVMSQALRRGS